MKNILLLGATGSIGTQTLDVIRDLDGYKIRSVSAGKNIERLISIIDEFSPEYVAVLEKETAEQLKLKYPHIEFGHGEASLIKAATYYDDGAYLINAIVGMAGLVPTIEAIKAKNNILLANKETLVCAGDIINNYVKEYKVKLIPIDSEHSTIYQCLGNNSLKDVRRVIITASGGSFRDKTLSELEDVTIEEALNHPNWSMGPKITIDSATMVNKGLEVIEAHYLFGLNYDQIETVLHYESIIHSLVEYNDGNIIAGLSYPDMKLPISYALTEPSRAQRKGIKFFDFLKEANLGFKSMDYNRYPLLQLAFEVGRMGGIMPMVYNSSNEVAVNLFLMGKIKFTEIEKVIRYGITNTRNKVDATLEDIINSDRELRKMLIDKFEVNK